MPKLSRDYQDRYCLEYAIDLNRIQAVIRTRHWKYTDPETGEQQHLDASNPKHRSLASGVASRLHSYKDVQERIDELLEAYADQCEVDKMRVVDRIRHIAFDFEPDSTPTWTEILAALEKMAKHKLVYSEHDKERADAMGKMFSEILTTKDGLPSDSADPTSQAETE